MDSAAIHWNVKQAKEQEKISSEIFPFEVCGSSKLDLHKGVGYVKRNLRERSGLWYRFESHRFIKGNCSYGHIKWSWENTE